MKFIAALIAAALALPASAHEGHDDAAPPTVSAQVAPRAAGESDEFELVAVVQGNELILYLDRYSSNEPVAGAQLEVEGGGFRGIAAETAPGVYSMPAAGLATPGRHALTISVQAGDVADLLTATLDVGKPAAAGEHARPWGQWAAWGAFGTLLLGGVFITLRRRNKQG